MSSLPHVTEILRDARLVDTTWFTEEARDRGTALHRTVHYYHEGDLDEGSVAPIVRPRFSSYLRFLEEVKPEIEACEVAVESALGYCGRADLILAIKGVRSVLDIKGPTADNLWHGVQLAAYQHAAAARGNPVVGRWNLYLGDKGYRLVERKDPDDWRAFQAALTLANWRRKHAA